MLKIIIPVLKNLNAIPPFFIIITLNGIFKSPQGSLVHPHGYFPYPLDVIYALPIGYIRSFDDNLDLVMKPVFRKVWRAAGQAESFNYKGDQYAGPSY